MTPAIDDPALESLRYPIGRFEESESYSAVDLADLLQRFALAPRRLHVAVRDLSVGQLDTVYRPEGWTVRQVIHHLADSAINGNQRFRWALTEEEPTIKAYDENAWAQLDDACVGPIEPSLQLFEGVSGRLASLLASLSTKDWSRRFYHPESKRHWRLDSALALYAWHHDHHVAHISSLRDRSGW